jgi:hypothetical protein
MAFDRYSAGKYSSYNRYRGNYNNIKAENAKKRAEVQGLMDDGGYSRQEAIQILDGGLETVIE